MLGHEWLVYEEVIELKTSRSIIYSVHTHIVYASIFI
jgi:hypothetical protein